MDQVHVIRHKVLVEGQSIRRTAREMGVSRNTVRKYLRVSEPVRKEETARVRPVLEKVAPRIEEVLEDWGPRTTPKQRVTGRRLHRQLVEEGYEVANTHREENDPRGGIHAGRHCAPEGLTIGVQRTRAALARVAVRYNSEVRLVKAHGRSRSPDVGDDVRPRG